MILYFLSLENLMKDPALLAEMIIVPLIIVVQIVIYSRNKGSIKRLGKVFPNEKQLDIELVPIKPQKVGEHEEESPTAESGKLSLLKKFPKHSKTFTQILEITNLYIERSKGGISFPAIEQIAERKSKSMEEAIESVLVLPLYIGLLGTFSGVILGLINLSITGFTEATIQTFIGGVLVGMIASALGLFLTIRSNGTFKNSKKKRDDAQYDYFNFVRQHLLPPSHKTIPTDFKSLRYNLATFHDEFVNYQQGLNTALLETIKRFTELQDVFQNMKEMEGSLSNIVHFLKNNNSLIEKQAENLNNVTQKTADLGNQIGSQIDRVDYKLQSMGKGTDSSLEILPVEEVDNGISVGSPAAVPQASPEVMNALLERIEDNEAATRQIATQVTNLYTFLQKTLSDEDGQKKNFFNSFSFKLFTFLGTLTFLLALGGGGWYLLTQLGVL